jgi:hypothetical protein
MQQQKIKIAIIENQITHFKKIYDRLKDNGNNFEIVPKKDEDEYIKITNWARIYLDSRYGQEKREKARDALKEFLEKAELDLIIIDHVLLGFTLDLTMNPDGIKLINDLWEISEVIKKIPVIFLSSAHPNDFTVLKRLQKINNDDTIKIKPVWEHKKPTATSGPIGDNAYFKQIIIPTIIELVDKAKSLTKGEKLAIKLEELNERFQRAKTIPKLYEIEEKYQTIINYCRSDQLDNDFLEEIGSLINNIEKIFLHSSNGFTEADLENIVQIITEFDTSPMENTNNV